MSVSNLFWQWVSKMATMIKFINTNPFQFLVKKMRQLTPTEFNRLNKRLDNAKELGYKLNKLQKKMEDLYIGLQVLGNELQTHRKLIKKLKNR